MRGIWPTAFLDCPKDFRRSLAGPDGIFFWGGGVEWNLVWKSFLATYWVRSFYIYVLFCIRRYFFEILFQGRIGLPPSRSYFWVLYNHYLSFKIIELIRKYEICCKPHAFTRGHCYMYIYYAWTISGGSPGVCAVLLSE